MPHTMSFFGKEQFAVPLQPH